MLREKSVGRELPCADSLRSACRPGRLWAEQRQVRTFAVDQELRAVAVGSQQDDVVVILVLVAVVVVNLVFGQCGPRFDAFQ